jgi:hypothetical protein
VTELRHLDFRLEPSLIKLLPVFGAGPEWMRRDDLACLPVDGQVQDIFFSVDPREQQKAAALCDGCPARTECNQYALVNRERFGVWGGENRSGELSKRRKTQLRKDVPRYGDEVRWLVSRGRDADRIGTSLRIGTARAEALINHFAELDAIAQAEAAA